MYNLILKLRKSFDSEENLLVATDLLLLLNIFPQDVFALKKNKVKVDIANGSAFSYSYLLNLFSMFFESSGGFRNVLFSIDPFSVSLKKIKANQKRLVSLALLKNKKGFYLKFNDISVLVSTIHGVKGLESTNVFLYNDVPKRVSLSALSKKTLTDELRVWFVGVTRARKNLFIVKGVLGSKNFFSL